ncbi:MAG: carboxylesterase/lipase family protein, partial [Myxococcales bacterium]|nr:carboxylesterase/lipase family protein [Myxococcales bacterium]
PPVGPLRFAAPRPPASWAGVRECTEPGGCALQPPIMLPLPGMDVGRQDEDCLYLNVFTPAADDARRPVLFWIHGGAFVLGSGSQTIYDGDRLARRGDVVVVTINYRLGALGFLHLAELCPDLQDAVSNCGIRDQVAALRWVRENIAAFGGDPGNVTVFGESAGGMSVGTLLGTPSAQGLFARAIPQSGAAHNIHDPETATRVGAKLLETLGVERSAAARALRELPAEKLRDAQTRTSLALGTELGLLPFQPVVCGDLLPQAPIEAVRAGLARGVDLLVGTTRDEWRLFGFLDPSIQSLDEPGLHARFDHVNDPAALVAAYRDAHGEAASAADLYFAIETDRVFRVPADRLAEAMHAHGGKIHFYRFDWEAGFAGGILGACHAVELPFVFGATDPDQDGADFFAAHGPEADALAQATMDAWLAFARSGDPSHAGLPGGRFPAWCPDRRETLVLGKAIEPVEDPAAGPRRAWDGLL